MAAVPLPGWVITLMTEAGSAANFVKKHPKLAAQLAVAYAAPAVSNYALGKLTPASVKMSKRTSAYGKKLLGSGKKRGGAFMDVVRAINKVNPLWYAYKGIKKLRGKGLKNHKGGTGKGGRGKPSAAQMRARRQFAQRFGKRRRLI